MEDFRKIRNIIEFAEKILGMPLHAGQIFWLQNATKKVNILKPANQWGKTTVEAITHIYHAMCKPQLDRFNMTFDTWFDTRYETLNFGKTYEVARGVQEHIIDIVEGKYLLPDGNFNKSLLKDWAIVKIEDMPKLPRIVWATNAVTLIRSYDGIGESFKRKRLAFVGGDECGDIPELNLFLTGTLMPRVFFYQGSIHLVGTSQPKGVEYEDLAAAGEEAMTDDPQHSQYFVLSANTNPQMATIYQNDFMPTEHIKEIENIADPELKKQIIYGMYVDWSKHLYTWDEVNQMFTPDIPWDPETGFSEAPKEGSYYIFSVDMAASEDETSCTCIEYNIRESTADGSFKHFPHRIAYHRYWKGNTFPLYLQYQIILEDYFKFKRVSPKRCRFVYDAGSLGGKNAGEAFKEAYGYPFPPKGRSYAEIKGEAFGVVKEVLGRDRVFDIGEKGIKIDRNPKWGGIRASSQMKELRRQIEVASRDDDKLKQDQFSSFMMGLHYIERRTPKVVHTKAVDFNYNTFATR
jgi:hypothetical protein